MTAIAVLLPTDAAVRSISFLRGAAEPAAVCDGGDSYRTGDRQEGSAVSLDPNGVRFSPNLKLRLCYPNAACALKVAFKMLREHSSIVPDSLSCFCRIFAMLYRAAPFI